MQFIPVYALPKANSSVCQVPIVHQQLTHNLATHWVGEHGLHVRKYSQTGKACKDEYTDERGQVRERRSQDRQHHKLPVQYEHVCKDHANDTAWVPDEPVTRVLQKRHITTVSALTLFLLRARGTTVAHLTTKRGFSSMIEGSCSGGL